MSPCREGTSWRARGRGALGQGHACKMGRRTSGCWFSVSPIVRAISPNDSAVSRAHAQKPGKSAQTCSKRFLRFFSSTVRPSECSAAARASSHCCSGKKCVRKKASCACAMCPRSTPSNHEDSRLLNSEAHAHMAPSPAPKTRYLNMQSTQQLPCHAGAQEDEGRRGAAQIPNLIIQ